VTIPRISGARIGATKIPQIDRVGLPHSEPYKNHLNRSFDELEKQVSAKDKLLRAFAMAARHCVAIKQRKPNGLRPPTRKLKARSGKRPASKFETLKRTGYLSTLPEIIVN